MGKYFGTDGIRGIANQDLGVELAYRVGLAAATVLSRKLLPSVLIFMAYSSIMAIAWIFMRSPDLAIAEAAIGAGVTTVLFIATLRRVNALKEGERDG